MTLPSCSFLSHFLLLKLRFTLLIFLMATINLSPPSLLAAEVATQEEKPAAERIETVADQLEYDRVNKKVIGKGNVVVTYKGMKLSADYAEVETETKRAYARGHVVLIREDQLAARGEEIYYDFANNSGQFPGGRSIHGPWFAKGEEIKQTEEGKYEVERASITTCDLEERPHFEIRAKRVSIYTGDKIFARNIWLYVLGKPIFWWPYLIFPLQESERKSPIEIHPGYSSQDGAYLLTSKGYSLAKWLWGRWHIDWRQKRGFGAGADFDYRFEGLKTDGNIRLYLTQDRNAPNTAHESIAQNTPYAERQDRERGRVLWRHRTDFTPHTHLILRFHKLADEFFLQDFFEREFRSDIESSSFANFVSNSELYGFYIFNQARINDFDSTVERLPEIRFDWKNAPFLSRHIYYQSATSFANLNKTYSHSEDDDSNLRFDTFHEWTIPLKWREIKFTPSANIRETIYGRDKINGHSHSRTALGVGLDTRTHFYRVFDQSFDFLGIEANQLRHVLEPSFRYDGILHSTFGADDLVKFDSIDTIDNTQRFTLGLENRIQTKRVVGGKMKRVDFVSLNTFLSYDILPNNEVDRSGFSIWSSEFTLRPYSWMQYEMRFDYDMERDKFHEFNQDLLLKAERLRILFGHRFVGRRDFLGIPRDDNQFVFDGSYWLNDKWKVGGYIRFEAESHELEEWQISATRDLHDFLLDFGYNVRNSDIDESNKEFFFLFRLKAFPEYPLKAGNRAEFAEPRIGQTVQGANQAYGLRGVEV